MRVSYPPEERKTEFIKEKEKGKKTDSFQKLGQESCATKKKKKVACLSLSI